MSFESLVEGKKGQRRLVLKLSLLALLQLVVVVKKQFLFNQLIAVPTLPRCILAINPMEDLVMLGGLMPGPI